MTNFLVEWITHTWDMVLEAAPWLLAGFIFAGVVYILLPTNKVVSHLGKPGLAGVIKASLVGVPLPLCSCSVIPVASSIRKQGASRGATASFLISTPESGIDSIAISYALLGPFLAIVRPLAAFVSALVAGCLISRFEKQTPVSQNENHSTAADTCETCSCESTNTNRSTFAGSIVTAIRYGLGDMFSDLAHWLVLGFVLAGLVSAIVPAQFFEQTTGSGLITMLLMILVGLPLYICATSSTPIAAALIAKGLSPGAALVLLLVGPATNIATMVVVAKDLGRGSLFLYLLSIVVIALLMGMGTDALVTSSPILSTVTHNPPHSHTNIVSWICAFGLTLLILNGLRLRILR
ncbi:MAG: SO_0444 family Cu/Zn efflux transporter, partial [Planctomycetota bacterium]